MHSLSMYRNVIALKRGMSISIAISDTYRYFVLTSW
jgi:hypothetical protein